MSKQVSTNNIGQVGDHSIVEENWINQHAYQSAGPITGLVNWQVQKMYNEISAGQVESAKTALSKLESLLMQYRREEALLQDKTSALIGHDDLPLRTSMGSLSSDDLYLVNALTVDLKRLIECENFRGATHIISRWIARNAQPQKG